MARSVVSVQLYHIVEQYILKQNDLNKAHFTSRERLEKIFMIKH